MLWEIDRIRIHKKSRRNILWVEFIRKEDEEPDPDTFMINVRMDYQGYLYTTDVIHHETWVNHWYYATCEVSLKNLHDFLLEVLKHDNVQRALEKRGMKPYKGTYAMRFWDYSHGYEPAGSEFRDGKLFIPNWSK